MTAETHWQLIPLDAFELPSPPARTLVQKGLDKFKRMIGMASSEQHEGQQQDAPHYRNLTARLLLLHSRAPLVTGQTMSMPHQCVGLLAHHIPALGSARATGPNTGNGTYRHHPSQNF